MEQKVKNNEALLVVDRLQGLKELGPDALRFFYDEQKGSELSYENERFAAY